MVHSNHQHLYFIKVNQLLGINSNNSGINALSQVIIPDFIITQLSVLLEKANLIDKCSVHPGQDTTVPDKESFSLKDVLHNLLIRANTFTEAEREQGLEMILISFKEVQASLLISEMYDLASLMSLAIENIQLACKNESIEEQNLLIAKVLDIIYEMNLALDEDISPSNTCEVIDMSYENLQQNMSYFAAREISLND